MAERLDQIPGNIRGFFLLFCGMRKMSLLTLLLLIAACSKKEEKGNLHITGNINGLKSGTLYIEAVRDTTLMPLDTIKISGNSAFESHLNIESPEMLYLILDRGATSSGDDKLMFFAEPGKINIESNLKAFYADARITGSKNHELYEQYRKVKNRFISEELDLTEKKLNAFRDKKQFDEAQNQAALESILKRKYLYAINFALNNKNHEIAPYIALSEIKDANLKYLDTICKSLSPDVAKSKYGKTLSAYIEERKNHGY